MNEKSTNENAKGSQQKSRSDNKNYSKKETEIQTQKKAIAELEDKLLRSYAENENLRKRHGKELVESSKYSIKNFAFSLLSVIDNFQRAFKSVPKDNNNDIVKNLLIGIQAVEKELKDSLEKNGIKMFESLNIKFNPELHQAISEVHHKSDKGIIVEEIQKGFMIGDRLLRPAMVIVSKGRNEKDEKSEKNKRS